MTSNQPLPLQRHQVRLDGVPLGAVAVLRPAELRLLHEHNLVGRVGGEERGSGPGPHPGVRQGR